jgi:hypothetical protein
MTPIPHHFFEKQRLSNDRTPLKDIEKEPFHKDKNESSQMWDIMSSKSRKVSSSTDRKTSEHYGSSTKKQLNSELTGLQQGK